MKFLSFLRQVEAQKADRFCRFLFREILFLLPAMDPNSSESTAAPERPFYYIAERAPTDQFLLIVGGDSHVLGRRWTSRSLHGSPEEGELCRFFYLALPTYFLF
jgi:hypothetical protein